MATVQRIVARWQPCSIDAPSARAGHIACAVDKRQEWGVELVVIHGGVNSDKEALEDLAVLQCEQQEWLAIDAPRVGPAARAFHAAVAVGPLVYIFGGHVFVKQQQKLHQFNDIWALDTDTWQWHRQEVPPEAPAPVPRDRASLIALDPSRLLLFGGADATNRRLDDCWIFHIPTQRWTEVTPVGPKPRPRCQASLFTVGNRVMMFGGDANGANNDLWSLRGIMTTPASSSSGNDKAGGQPPVGTATTTTTTGSPPGAGSDSGERIQWTLLQLDGVVPSPRRGHAAAPLGPWIVIMGGLSEQKGMLGMKRAAEHQADIAVLERGRGVLTWRSVDVITDTMPDGREKHSLTALSTGRLLMFGGTDGQGTLGDAWWLELEDIAAAPELVQVYGPDGLPPPPAHLQRPPGDEGMGSYWASLPAALQQGVPALAGAVPAGLTTAISSWRGRWGGLPLGPTAAAGGGGGITGTGASGTEFTLSVGADAAALGDEALLDLGTRMLVVAGAQGVGGSAAEPEAETEAARGSAAMVPSGEVAVAAARRHLATCPPSELRIGDVGTLLGDYRRLARVGWAAAVAARGPSALAELEFIVPGRYAHFVAEEVRMKDVAALQGDYRALLTAAGQVQQGLHGG